MKVAIVGSRNYPHEDLVREFVRRLMARDPKLVIVSGGARGPDSWAETEARRHSVPVDIIPADWDTHGRRAGILRNSTIVARSERVIAFWDGKSNGTMDTVRKAKAQGKKVVVIGPGRVPIDPRV
jgi:predicted Rossmann fold nucleotide-binding protein DprA/Smf involved in DNA uptake